MTTGESAAPRMLDAARDTLALDIWPVPNKPSKKRPPMLGWQNLRLTIDDLQEHFSNGNGLGWLLGIKPRPIADVDIDCGEAVAVSSLIPLLKTNRIFGRLSNPCSHYLYELPEEFESKSFKDPLRNGTDKYPVIIELRGRGGQTVVPPSVHPSGEQIKWEHEGDFGKTTLNVLQILVAKIAAASLLVRYWPRGHETRHALTGMLARAGWTEEATAEFVCAILRVAQPENREGRADVYNSYLRLKRGDEVAGRPTLEERLGENGKLIVRTVAEWLGLKEHHAARSGLILNNNGKIRPLLANAITVLREDSQWKGVLAFNEFSLYVVTQKATPWGKPAGENWTDTDDIRTSEWLQHHGILVNPQVASQRRAGRSRGEPLPSGEGIFEHPQVGWHQTSEHLARHLSRRDADTIHRSRGNSLARFRRGQNLSAGMPSRSHAPARRPTRPQEIEGAAHARRAGMVHGPPQRPRLEGLTTRTTWRMDRRACRTCRHQTFTQRESEKLSDRDDRPLPTALRPAHDSRPALERIRGSRQRRYTVHRRNRQPTLLARALRRDRHRRTCHATGTNFGPRRCRGIGTGASGGSTRRN